MVLAGALAGHVAIGLHVYPSAQFEKYPVNAALLASGSSQVFPSDGSPAYLLLHMLFGAHCRGAVHGLQIGAGVAATLAAWHLARSLGGRVAGLVAGLLLAFAAPTILYESILEPDSLIAALALGSLAAAVAARPVGAGLLGGLAVALRPTALPLALLLAAFFLVRRERRKAALYLGMVTMVAAVPVVAMRARFGGSVAATMSTGQIFHQGNAPETIGFPSFVPLTKTLEAQPSVAVMADAQHETYRMVARAAAGRALSAAECERFWLGRAFAFIGRHPAAWLRIVYYKAALLFGPYEFPDMPPVLRELGRPAPPLLPSPALYPLGAFGLLLCLYARRGALLAFAAIALGAPLVLFAVDARYRIVLAPLACAGIGVALGLLVEKAKQWDRRATGVLLAALATSLPLVIPPPSHAASARALRKQVRSSLPYVLATRLRDAGDLEAATRAMQDSFTIQPSGLMLASLVGLRWEEPAFWEPVRAPYERKLGVEPSAALEFDAGVIDELAGRLDEAIGHFERAGDAGYYVQDLDSGEPLHRAGRLLLRRGRYAEALAVLRRSLAARPGVMVTLATAEVAAHRAGDEQAERAFGEELAALHDPVSAGYERARADRWSGDAAAALRAIEPVVAALGDSGVVRYEECRIALDLGDRRRALVAYGKALALAPDHPFEAAPLDGAVAEAIAAHPADAALSLVGAEHALRRARFDEALRLARAAVPSLASDPAATARLAFIARFAERASAHGPSGAPAAPR